MKLNLHYTNTYLCELMTEWICTCDECYSLTTDKLTEWALLTYAHSVVGGCHRCFVGTQPEHKPAKQLGLSISKADQQQ